MALRGRGEVKAPTFAFRASKWWFADCKSYMDTQEGQNEPDDSLPGDLIESRRLLATGHAPTTLLYLQLAGTWMVFLLDVVNKGAAKAAHRCPDAPV